MKKNYFVSGDYNAICDSCGQKVKASLVKKRWDGLMVCSSCWEPRQPQDFVKAKTDKIIVPWTRPRPVDVFYLTQGLLDSFTINDDPVDYIDPTYFLEDYIQNPGVVITMTYNRLFSDSVALTDVASIHLTKPISDTITLSDSGSITLPAYIDPTYFASDYMATTQSF